MTDGRALLEAHLNGEPLTEAQRAALSAWVCASRDNARLVAELTHFNEAIALNIKAQSFGSLMDSPEADLFQDAFDQDEPPAERDEQELPPIHLDATALTKEKYLSALTYVLKHTFTPKRVAILASAATVLLGVALTIVLMSGPDDADTQPIANVPEPTTPSNEAPAIKPTVATLTNTHNATWGRPTSAGPEHPLTTGSKLHPNTRLTLTAGFAEITTHRGAVALIQAPATIELLNHNAIHLHTGKLVGICETESSKGFLVRTPHMDITDLGTRFGVDATQTRATEVHVFDGKVAVERLDAPADTEPTLLLAGESARATGVTDGIVSIDHDIDRFAAMLPATIPLPSTGQGLAAGEIDPRWTVIAVDGQELDTSPPVRVFDEPETRGNGPREARWIGLKTNGEDSVLGQGQTVVLQTQFWIPSTADTGACTLQLRFIADYRLLSLVVNGQKVDVPPNQLHSKMSEMVFSEHLIHGSNNIRFEIQDDARPRGVNYVGLRASWQLHTKNTTPE